MSDGEDGLIRSDMHGVLHSLAAHPLSTTSNAAAYTRAEVTAPRQNNAEGGTKQDQTYRAHRIVAARVRTTLGLPFFGAPAGQKRRAHY